MRITTNYRIWMSIAAIIVLILLAIIFTWPRSAPLEATVIKAQFEALVEAKSPDAMDFFRDNMAKNGRITVESPFNGKVFEISFEEFLDAVNEFDKVSFFYKNSAFQEKIDEIYIVELPKKSYLNWLLLRIADPAADTITKRQLADTLLRVVEKDALTTITGGGVKSFEAYLSSIATGQSIPGGISKLGAPTKNNKYSSMTIDSKPASVNDIQPNASIVPSLPRSSYQERPIKPNPDVAPPPANNLPKPKDSLEKKPDASPQITPEPPSFNEAAFKKEVISILEANFNIIRERGSNPAKISDEKVETATLAIIEKCKNDNIRVIEQIKDQSGKFHEVQTGEDPLILTDYIDELYAVKMTNKSAKKPVKITEIAIDKGTRKVTVIKILSSDN